MAVNELLVQLQSFDEPSGWQKVQSKFVDWANLYLPPDHQLKRPQPPSTNVLIIASTTALVVIIGISRLYLGVHYFSDVAGGYAAGLLWLCACIAVLERRLHPTD